jgi:prepilin-type N-terminal cleavage/methylation domain-containing protein
MDENFSKKTCKGFTLIELSIVLVIIALIIGAISAGSSLVKNAKVNAVIREFQTLQSAIAIFKQQYSYYPGDFPTASAIWQTSSTALCGSITLCICSSANACNGNGNGKIEIPTTSIYSRKAESARAWQHLSLASVLPQFYNMITDTTSGYSIGFALIGSSIPASKYDSLDRQSNSAWGFNSGNVLTFGGLAYQTTTSTTTYYGFTPQSDAVSPVDSYSIDLKIDDGIRMTGDVTAINGVKDLTGVDTSCQNTADPSGYLLTNKDRGCLMSFSFN